MSPNPGTNRHAGLDPAPIAQRHNGSRVKRGLTEYCGLLAWRPVCWVACVLLLVPLSPAAGVAQAASRWDTAEAAIERLPPAAFAALPVAVARDLERRGCSIPQPWAGYGTGPANVIAGEFQAAGQTDWAVLCSLEGASSLLVFWNGSAERVEQVRAPSADRGGLQVVTGEGEIGYSILIQPVGEAYILDHYEAYGGPEPPPIDHQGINYAFMEKASVVLYWHQGEWLQLQGAD